jgi:hypothetical protein
VLEPRRLDEVEPELRAAGERVPDRLSGVGLGRRGGGRTAEHARVFAEEECDTVETRSDPDELSRRAELVELKRLVARHAPRQHLGLPELHRERKPLERNERLAERRAAVDPVPAREEATQRRLLGGLDLLAKRGERRAAQAAQHVGVAPLPLGAAGAKLPADQLLLALELAQLKLDVAAEVLVRLAGRERTATLGIPEDELLQSRIGV